MKAILYNCVGNRSHGSWTSKIQSIFFLAAHQSHYSPSCVQLNRGISKFDRLRLLYCTYRMSKKIRRWRIRLNSCPVSVSQCLSDGSRKRVKNTMEESVLKSFVIKFVESALLLCVYFAILLDATWLVLSIVFSKQNTFFTDFNF